MTNGEQSFGTLLWVVIGAVVAIGVAGGNWVLGGLGAALGLYPVLILCNCFSKVERQEQRKGSRPARRR